MTVEEKLQDSINKRGFSIVGHNLPFTVGQVISGTTWRGSHTEQRFIVARLLSLDEVKHFAKEDSLPPPTRRHYAAIVTD